ncbi:restriction endonuclease subunit S [Desulfobacterales bacterium HSG17]|nr:restriction endonuclease subunit S [Desulfobacterales bacterium HSG17]
MTSTVLGDICQVAAGQSAPQNPTVFSKKGKPFIRAGSLERLVNGGAEEECELIPDENASQLRLRLFPQNTILFPKSGMSAKIGRVHRLRTASYVVSHLAAVMPGPKVNPNYLHRWFEKNPPSRLIPNEAYPSIRITEIASLKIELPSLNEQKRIAAILDKADAIRRKRQQAIKLADELLCATFIDLFGDPVTNPKGYEIQRLGDHCEGMRYGTSIKCFASKTATSLPVLRIPNIAKEKVNFNNLVYADLSKKEVLKLKLLEGDLLFVRTNGNPDYIGRCAVYKHSTDMIYASYLIRARLKKECGFLSDYIQACISSKSYRKIIIKEAKTTAGNYNINTQGLKGLKIPMAPLEKQKEYIDLKKIAEKQIEKKYLCLEQSEYLFKSLAQRAFRGEL